MNNKTIELVFWVEYVSITGLIEGVKSKREYPLDFLLAIGKSMQTVIINTELENLYNTATDSIALVNEGVVANVVISKNNYKGKDIDLTNSYSNLDIELEPRLECIRQRI